MSSYGYNDLLADMEEMMREGYKVQTLGYSVLGRVIYGIKTGSSQYPKVLIQGAIHSREQIVSKLIVRLAREYKGQSEILFIPMVNPDGVELTINGLSSVGDMARRQFLLSTNGGDTDFSLWKANADAVDLNTNFDAAWGTGLMNVREPAPDGYIGPYPFSEPESRLLRDITYRDRYSLTISYHIKGEVIYWGFGNNYNFGEQAQMFSDLTGYPLLASVGSAGGYKDWYDITVNGLGLTIEAGSDQYGYPYPMDQLEPIYQQNKGVPALADEAAREIWNMTS